MSSVERGSQLQCGPVNGASVPSHFWGVGRGAVQSHPKRGGLPLSGHKDWVYPARGSSASRNKLSHSLSEKTDNLLKITRDFASSIQSLNLLAAASGISQSQLRQFPEWNRVGVNSTDLLPNGKKNGNLKKKTEVIVFTGQDCFTEGPECLPEFPPNSGLDGVSACSQEQHQLCGLTCLFC